MILKSAAFDNLDRIPVRFTGDGQNISPPLYWNEVPVEASSFILFCHDPDAPVISKGGYGFVHWILYNIPYDVRGINEAEKLFKSGINDDGGRGYLGPYPPPFHGIHNYYFVIVALDTVLDMDDDLNLWDVLERVQGHVIEVARLIGTYER